MRKYEPENVLQATARRAFKGVLSGADKAQADAAVDMKMNERKKQTTRKGPSLGEILLREQKWSSEPTRHETELAKKQAVTTEGKLRAVVVEIKFDGQNGRRTQFFRASTSRIRRGSLLVPFHLRLALRLRMSNGSWAERKPVLMC